MRETTILEEGVTTHRDGVTFVTGRVISTKPAIPADVAEALRDIGVAEAMKDLMEKMQAARAAAK